MRAFAVSPKYESRAYSDVNYVESAVVQSEDGSEITLFAVNRDLENAIPVAFTLRGFDEFRPVEHIALECDDLKAVNTADAPDTVKPASLPVSGGAPVLPKHSWNVLRYKRTEG